ncbi:hypothetical protein E5675_11085 [Sphingopyxis sp. PAMC25046]|uniref:hypothetical protein n=1 Tax=Sphingopyxis sp. PAMC25046 TaxID=2565556 RepID=UPI00109DCEC9|nr:hypothetical protein [Sphingopyxis sp. PAMC25046]QCB54925.1 hypothetical protein E5675_11085 [Sphingopyxis sp. PAMC25046]
MRLVMTVIVPIAAALWASNPAPAQAPAPFDGSWMSCDTYQGAEICEYKMLAQRGDRLCGVQRYFATNAYYEQRFVGKVNANVAHIEKICGDPGSETDTYCSGRAPSGAAKVGWQAIDRKLGLCGGRLVEGGRDFHSCTSEGRHLGMPRADELGEQGPGPEDRAWLTSCAGGAE